MPQQSSNPAASPARSDTNAQPALGHDCKAHIDAGYGPNVAPTITPALASR
ncbi:hypothetical protein M441DRAFT_388251 [Trichoderma asperellum CBS 433.97]|uniref:Uncharacterized protein n=1 Tax=Trichoderma asperellum (strain ATCC 204424 / CBS 433.97 / NBRC 101777) TaxID=1042311 RepID=A0A2T3ZC17_TRIA4|nr:hypothetical protein M441DRAFT_388251 [Trichoderma asperellum CBS 433.97]PTB42332.1 hypothetical protein M441DRAFT_388251 [Trichoderma asperellum CBS 433.97]